MKIESTNAIPLIGAERVIYKVNGTDTSFTEMMALPNSQLDTTYWLPWYNNKELDAQLRFANVSDAEATVHVYIGGVEMAGSPYTLAPGASLRKSYASIDKGPVKVESNVNIVVAERVIYRVNGVSTSFSEMMACRTTCWMSPIGSPGITMWSWIHNSGSGSRKSTAISTPCKKMISPPEIPGGLLFSQCTIAG